MILANIPQSQIFFITRICSGFFLFLNSGVLNEIDKYKINLYLSGDITITSNHRRSFDNIKSISSKHRKGYRIRKSTQRNLISSAFFLFLKKTNKIVFLTLTFDREIRPGERINPYLNKFLSNLRINYGLKNYIWARENHKNGNPHIHLIADLPYIPIQKINKIWIQTYAGSSRCAVRLPKDHKSIVNDLEKCTRYVTKYITKDENGNKKSDKIYFNERCYAVSQPIQVKPVRLSYFDFRSAYEDHKKDFKFKVWDHCTTVKIWDFFKKSDYFVSFLGNLTENEETLLNNGETVKAIESRLPGRVVGSKTGQTSIFDTS